MFHVSCHLLGLKSKFQAPTVEETGPLIGKTANRSLLEGGKSDQEAWQVRESAGLLSNPESRVLEKGTRPPSCPKVLLSLGLGGTH